MIEDTSPAPSELLSVRQLRICYPSATGWLRIVDDVSFELGAGAALGLVGESGCGKSQTALALMGVCSSAAKIEGQVHLAGEDVLRIPSARRRALSGASMAMVFQDPMASLNPYLRIGVQLSEVLERHRGASRATAWIEAARTLDAVRVSAARARLDQFPHELSGGMRQRVMIAMAIIAGPRLLIADEPTTALDPTVQDQILTLLEELRRDRGLAILVITHDLHVVARLCDSVVVMYAGQVVESGPTSRVLVRPRHPYTAALLRARPSMRDRAGVRLQDLPGQPPAPGEGLSACRFVSRCSHRQPDCQSPVPLEIADAARLRCRHPLFDNHRSDQ